jgi:hypothetical protein
VLGLSDDQLTVGEEGRRVRTRREDLEKLVGTTEISPGSFLTVAEASIADPDAPSSGPS